MNTHLTYGVGAKKVGFYNNADGFAEKANAFFGTVMNVFEKPCSESDGVPCRLEKSDGHNEKIFDVKKLDSANIFVERSPNGTSIVGSTTTMQDDNVGKRTYMLEGALLAIGAIILLKAIL